LRRKTSDVEEIDHKIRAFVDDMIETMYDADGIGLAAPQVGEVLSICVIDNGLIDDEMSAKAYINPHIYDDEGSVVMEEGCLSIPDIREDVTRPEIIRLTYLDIDGVEHDEKCDGMLARVLQHEIDHLNGVLFVDRIGPVRRKLIDKRLKKLAEGSK